MVNEKKVGIQKVGISLISSARGINPGARKRLVALIEDGGWMG